MAPNIPTEHASIHNHAPQTTTKKYLQCLATFRVNNSMWLVHPTNAVLKPEPDKNCSLFFLAAKKVTEGCSEKICLTGMTKTTFLDPQGFNCIAFITGW